MFEAESSNAKAAIDVLVSTAQAQVSNDQAQVAALQTQLATTQNALDAVKAQLAAIPPAPLVYDKLEYLQPSVNVNAVVGGSGLATAGFKPPSVECAEMWILDNPNSTAPNYADDYETWKFTPDGTKTKFRLEGGFLFPSAADIAACQCLEFEARQVTDDQKMVILAGQLQYSGGQLRFFDWQQRAWLPFGVSLSRPAPQTWVNVSVEGHRDSSTVYYDAMTLNGVRTLMTQKYPLLPTTWQPRLSASLQLDDNSAVSGFRVKIDGWRYILQ